MSDYVCESLGYGYLDLLYVPYDKMMQHELHKSGIRVAKHVQPTSNLGCEHRDRLNTFQVSVR